MNKEISPFNTITPPRVTRTRSHKRRLKVALLTAHEQQSRVQSFGRIINENVRNMSLGKKSTALATVAVFGLVVTAGVFGPTASDVAQAEASNTIKRAFARFVNLTDEEKASLEDQFQDRVHFRSEDDHLFHGMADLSEADRETMHENMKASLADSLVEAQAAADLEVVSANEMPLPGFIGNAGRALGIKMMHKLPENIENLPADIQDRIKEHEAMRADMESAKFLKYTNTDEQQVTLGLNANDEPVFKFVEGDFSLRVPGMPIGPGGAGHMMEWREKNADGSERSTRHIMREGGNVTQEDIQIIVPGEVLEQ